MDDRQPTAPGDQTAIAPRLPLTASGLSKRYGAGSWALRDVTVAIPAGARTALVGPNGAGKSSLIRTWLGFEKPTHGTASVHGVDPRRGGRRVLQRLAYLGQTPSLYPMLTVGDHLDFVRHYRGGRFDHARAAARLAALGIPVDARAGTLSGGQAAQLGLALVLGTRADILLLDEPLASLDPLARREFIDVMLADVAETGATLLLSSHVVSDVELACDRLVVLAGGRVVLDGPIADIVARHTVRADPLPRDMVVAPAGPSRRGTVVHVDSSPLGSDQRPTLEDVVLAYLAAGRV